ncbi:MFS transporter [Amycolatopsis taiwanensis]|uniref:MFS transporter n=1 Tax=Amycolatopsis taiwanensis TaxID=342230 RepID=UPI0004BBC93E|nr:MFS transporter [Amycolatopsis taiwanensis]
MSGMIATRRDVRDFYGRRYRVGESDRELLGRSRGWMRWAAWVAMLAAGAGQYGYGALLPSFVSAHGWSWQQGCWVLAVWTVCQSAALYPVARARARLRLAPAFTLAAGAVLCASGLLTLGGTGSFTVVMVNHAVLGGIGAGLIYGTCLSVVSRWYPEQPARTAVVSGAFAYGSIPILVVAGGVSHPATAGVVAGLAVLVLAGASAVVLRDPPEDWWPGHIDPREWALDKTVNPSLRRNRPAIRRYSVAEVVRCRQARTLYTVVACAAAVSLFDLAYLAVFARGAGLAAMGALAFASGLARGAAGWAGARFGRRAILRTALAVGGVAQLVLLAGDRDPAVLFAGACLAGAASGACYALLPSLVESHFGERLGLPNFGLFYGAKAAGGLIGALFAAYFSAVAGFLVTAGLALFAAILLRSLRQPGRPRLLA